MDVKRLSTDVQQSLNAIAKNDGKKGDLSSVDLKRASSKQLMELADNIAKGGIDENEKELYKIVQQLTEDKGIDSKNRKILSYSFKDDDVSSVKFKLKTEDTYGAAKELGEARAIVESAFKPEASWDEKVGNFLENIFSSEVMQTQEFINKLEERGVPISKADMEMIVKNQQRHGRSKEDIIAAIQAYGILQEARHLNIPPADEMQAVVDRLKDGSLHIDANSQDPDAKNGVSFYDNISNTVIQKGFKLEEPLDRSLLLHELVHGAQDVHHAGHGHDHTIGDIEMESYQAQSLYLYKQFEQRGAPMDKLIEALGTIQDNSFSDRLNFAMLTYAKNYYKNGADDPATKGELDMIRLVLKSSQTYKDGSSSLYHDKMDKKSRADGVH